MKLQHSIVSIGLIEMIGHSSWTRPLNACPLLFLSSSSRKTKMVCPQAAFPRLPHPRVRLLTCQSHTSLILEKRLPCGSSAWDPSRNQYEHRGIHITMSLVDVGWWPAVSTKGTHHFIDNSTNQLNHSSVQIRFAASKRGG